jgi:hypothetical protein
METVIVDGVGLFREGYVNKIVIIVKMVQQTTVSVYTMVVGRIINVDLNNLNPSMVFVKEHIENGAL